MGGREDRNFDAGLARDLNFDLLSWFEPSFLGGQKTSKCEHSKKTFQSVCFSTSCFKNLLLVLHRKNASFFETFAPLLTCSLCFLPSAAQSLKKTQKHRWIEIRFLGPLGPFLRFREPEILVRHVSPNSRFYHVVCLCGAVGVCGGRVTESVML